MDTNNISTNKKEIDNTEIEIVENKGSMILAVTININHPIYKINKEWINKGRFFKKN